MSAQQLITQHLDVWTSAHKTRSTAGRGSNNKLDLYGIKKLRELILELAVRGKLVLQDASDEPTSELLKKIVIEKERLIKEGKIKKEKIDIELSEADFSFEVPSGWEWVRLGNVINFINGYAFKSSDFSDQGIGIVKIGDIQNGVLTPETMSRVDPSVVESVDNSLRVEKGDMLIAMSGATTGKLGFNTTNECFYLNQRVGKICPYLINPNYLYFPLTTKIAENLEKSLGSAIPNLSTVQINDIVFALPPLAEQHRIVAKVDELMAFCDQLEQTQSDNIAAHAQLVEALLATLTNCSNHNELQNNWQRIAAHFDTLFTTEHSIDQLKQTILQLAVMGKLVSQNPNDEPASELLKKIAAEKAQLIKKGKIKKEKPLPEITDEEKPFELPIGWEWVRFVSLFSDLKYGTSHKCDYGIDGVPILRIPNVVQGSINSSDLKLTQLSESELKELYLQEGDILIIRSNGSVSIVGRSAVVDANHVGFGYAGYLVRIRFNVKFLHPYFCQLFLNSHLVRVQIEAPIRTTSGVKNINSTEISNLIVPIAPMEEQLRIVAKVDELMIFCEILKANLQKAQATQLALADALVEQAVL